MVKSVKSRKKFEKKHLGAALEKRKKFAARGNAVKRKAAAASGPRVEKAEEPAAAAVKKRAQNHSQTDSKAEDSQHKEQLESLKDKDPEFYEFLKEHDQTLLDFGSDGDEEDGEEEDLGLGLEDADEGTPSITEGTPVTLSTAVVDEWCASILEKRHVGSLRSFLQAFRTACHYGDGEGVQVPTKYNIPSSHVFNKVMMFGLCEIDGIFKQMLGISIPGGDKDAKHKGRGFSTEDLLKNSKWKKMEPFVKAYLGNALNVLKQMMDNDLTAFALRRLKVSVPFLGPFPNLARRFLKVTLHYLSTGDGVLPVMSLLFVREMALQLGEETLNAVLKGIYKSYAANGRFVNSTTLPQIRFRASCVLELYGIDLNVSYQLAYVFIQQMAVILRNAVTVKTKTAFRSVYCWQYMNCLQLWVQVISKYPRDDELGQLSYPLAQLLQGVAQLIPTARYFPLRLKCAKMMNDLAGVSGAYTPVAPLLLDMLQFKELFMTPTGGLGKASDFDTSLKIPKPTLRTQKLQEDCVAAVLEELARHLEQWSYAIAFPELAVVPVVQLRHFLKKTKVDRLCRKVKQLVEQVERNVQFVGRKRDGLNISLDNTASIQAFLQAEKTSRSSPLSQYLILLKERADQHRTFGNSDKNDMEDSKTLTIEKNSEPKLGNDEDDVVEDLLLSVGDEGHADLGGFKLPKPRKKTNKQ